MKKVWSVVHKIGLYNYLPAAWRRKIVKRNESRTPFGAEPNASPPGASVT